MMKGGFTISGGEPLMQDRFVVKLFTAAQAMGIHTALDSNGYLGNRLTDEELEKIDLVLLDIKAWDPERHRRLTGMDMGPVLNFARRLASRRKTRLAALRVGGRVDGRPGGRRSDLPTSLPASATWNGSMYYPFIRWAHSSGSSSASNTNFRTRSRPQRKPSKECALSSATKDSKSTKQVHGSLSFVNFNRQTTNNTPQSGSHFSLCEPYQVIIQNHRNY